MKKTIITSAILLTLNANPSFGAGVADAEIQDRYRIGNYGINTEYGDYHYNCGCQDVERETRARVVVRGNGGIFETISQIISRALGFPEAPNVN